MHAQELSQGAMCVQRFDDSLNPAIHITYRISLRSSSYQEPRDPSLSDMVVLDLPIKGISENKIVLLKKYLLRTIQPGPS